MDKNLKNISLNPPLVLTIGFGTLILIGSLLLNLGIFTKSGESIGYINALFTAGSASCVTGLVVENTAEFWNLGGQIVILILIQIGGLGIMTLATLFPMIMRKRIGLTSRQIIKESFNVDSIGGMVKLLKYVVSFTFTVELIGAGFLATRFVPKMGLGKGLWFSVFHSISAFCNAGFDITGNSIVPFQNDFIINIVLMFLILTGGLGFQVTSELINKKSWKKLSVQGKLVLAMTGILVFGGGLLIFLIEFNNPATLGNKGIYPKFIESLFQSVTTRTAGFNSVDISGLRDSTIFLFIVLMFIGGASGGTAGGLKTTTFGVLLSSMISTIRGEDDVVIFKKRISSDMIKKALALVMISIILVMGISFLLTLTETFNFLDIIFEVVSAFATVGLTRGITPNLSNIGKIIITLTMYIGRIGPLTMAFAFGKKEKKTKLKYPEANISVG